MARTVACRLSERKPGQKQRPRLGGAGPPVVGGIGVPLGVGTQTSKLRTQVRHSCPEAHCPEVQVHEPRQSAPKGIDQIVNRTLRLSGSLGATRWRMAISNYPLAQLN